MQNKKPQYSFHRNDDHRISIRIKEITVNKQDILTIVTVSGIKEGKDYEESCCPCVNEKPLS